MENDGYLYHWFTLNHKESGVEENDLDPDEGNQRLCGVCTLPILSTPYDSWDEENGGNGSNSPYDSRAEGNGGSNSPYSSCDEGNGRGHSPYNSSDEGNGGGNSPYNSIDEGNGGCNPAFRHKCCFEQHLPKVLTQHPLHPGRPLHLHNKQLDNIVCNSCLKKCKGLFYQCPDVDCRFAVDVKCCATVKVVHRSHRHELTFIPRKDNFLPCGACGMQHQGFFYGCDFCQFYLHQDCALLPNVILHKKHKDMQHPLALTFTLPKDSFKFRRCEECSICNEKLSSIKSGVYVCLRCDVAIHVKCAAISQESADFCTVSCRNIANGLPHFPMKNEHASLMPYLLEHQSNSGTIEEEEKKFFNHKIHDHELVLYDKYCDEPSQLSYLCEACIEPISAPFYSCPQCIDFYLHRCCANLPLVFQHPSHCRPRWGCVCKDKPLLQLVSRLSARIPFFCGRILGHCCWKKNNGFFYECQECIHRSHVQCAFLPNAITYELHGKSHILFLSYCYYRSYSMCPCCSVFIESLYYECSSCPNFKIHVHCALLPTSVSHKYDRHPLKLIPFEGKDDSGENFCEICERGMDNNKWFYHCKECVTSFHVDCIPYVGLSSKIKIGRTIHVRCHNCPLTSIQMLNNYSYTCSHCDKTIEGKENGIAFECIKCSFWLDEWCAENQQVGD